MAERTILAEYLVTDRDTTLMIIAPDADRPVIEHIPLSRSTLRDLVTGAFTSARLRPRDPAEWIEPLSQLVEPLTRNCEPDDQLWLVPHDVLHYVPLHALSTKDGPLIERNPVCYSPNASVMRYCRAKSRPGRSQVLVYTDTRADRPLVNARSQAEALASLFPDRCAIRSGSDATVAALLHDLAAASAGAAIVHLACHGAFAADDPLRSGLLLAPDGDDDGLLTVERLMATRLPAELVTLSACQSGVNERHRGDELVGLTRSLLYAGAASVIVSLWAVDDLSTGLLMHHLYAALTDGESRIRALRQAQLRVRDLTLADVVQYCESRETLAFDLADAHYRAGAFNHALAAYEEIAATNEPSPRLLTALSRTRAALSYPNRPPADYTQRAYSHPYHWAPFVLVGDWR